MVEPSCPGCDERDQVIEQLKAGAGKLQGQVDELRKQVDELKAKLNRNSSNSSTPPSQDPPDAPKAKPKAKGRKRGGQPGHQGHHRTRLPAERVNEVVRYVPQTCEHCQASLPDAPGPDDPEPRWHQTAELPASPVEVTEYQAHART